MESAKGNVAFKAGAVTGMLVAGLALLSISVYYAILDCILSQKRRSSTHLLLWVLERHLFQYLQIRWWNFTKGADVGADLVGKVTGIPEDDLEIGRYS